MVFKIHEIADLKDFSLFLSLNNSAVRAQNHNNKGTSSGFAYLCEYKIKCEINPTDFHIDSFSKSRM